MKAKMKISDDKMVDGRPQQYMVLLVTLKILTKLSIDIFPEFFLNSLSM